MYTFYGCIRRQWLDPVPRLWLTGRYLVEVPVSRDPVIGPGRHERMGPMGRRLSQPRLAGNGRSCARRKAEGSLLYLVVEDEKLLPGQFGTLLPGRERGAGARTGPEAAFHPPSPDDIAAWGNQLPKPPLAEHDARTPSPSRCSLASSEPPTTGRKLILPLHFFFFNLSSKSCFIFFLDLSWLLTVRSHFKVAGSIFCPLNEDFMFAVEIILHRKTLYHII